jgi:DNA-binding LacI/PurR family transcriptional regulator
MQPIRLLSIVEQTTEHLRKGLQESRWLGHLPGVVRLANEFDVSAGVVRKALRQLEAEGILTGRGLGRSRVIADQPGGAEPEKALRVGILLHDGPRDREPQTHQITLLIQHSLEAAGHTVFYTVKSQIELKHNVRLVARYIGDTPADAWVVVAGSRPLLEWFAEQAVPCMALYGRSSDLRLARTGPDKAAPLVAATRRLIELGHRRIVNIALSPRRIPTPGRVERAFLAELSAHNIPTGEYNLPDWVETPEGYSALLERLFRISPPTALIVDGAARMMATMQFLARRHIDVPGQVSLISSEYDNALSWCDPPIAQFQWDPMPIVRRIVRWVAAVQRENQDYETINYPAEFIPGGSIGPAPRITSGAGSLWMP